MKNHANRGVAYPSSQRMRLYGSLWNAEDWATQGGRVKTDWSMAPFVAQYRNFAVTASSPSPGGYYYDQEMDAAAQKDLKWARDNCIVYNYCADTKRFANGSTPECYMP